MRVKSIFSAWVGWGCIVCELGPGVCIHVGPVSVSCLHGQVWPGSGPGREREKSKERSGPCLCCLLPGAGDQHRPRSALQSRDGAA